MRQHTRDVCACLMSVLVRPITAPLWLGLLVAMSLIVGKPTIDSAQKPHIVIGPSVPPGSGVLVGDAGGGGDRRIRLGRNELRVVRDHLLESALATLREHYLRLKSGDLLQQLELSFDQAKRPY